VAKPKKKPARRDTEPSTLPRGTVDQVKHLVKAAAIPPPKK
jgi:hypothetical protein